MFQPPFTVIGNTVVDASGRVTLMANQLAYGSGPSASMAELVAEMLNKHAGCPLPNQKETLADAFTT